MRETQMKTKTEMPKPRTFSFSLTAGAVLSMTAMTAMTALAVFGTFVPLPVSAQTEQAQTQQAEQTEPRPLSQKELQELQALKKSRPHLTDEDLERMGRMKLDPMQKILVADFVNHIRGESAKYGIDPKMFVREQFSGEPDEYRQKQLAEKQRIREENAKKIAEYRAMQEERKAQGLPTKKRINEDEVAEIFAKTAGLSPEEKEKLREALRPKEDKDVVPGFEKPIDAAEELKNTDELFMDYDELRRQKKERERELARKRKKEDQQDILKRLGTEKSKLRIELERFNRKERMKAEAAARERGIDENIENAKAKEIEEEAEERRQLLLDSPYFKPNPEGGNDGHSLNEPLKFLPMPSNASVKALAQEDSDSKVSPIDGRGQAAGARLSLTNAAQKGVSATSFGLTLPVNFQPQTKRYASLRAVRFLFQSSFPFRVIGEAQAQTKPSLSEEDLRIEAPKKNVISAEEEQYWRNEHEKLKKESLELSQTKELQDLAKEALAAKEKFEEIAKKTKTASDAASLKFGKKNADNAESADNAGNETQQNVSQVTERFYTIFISESMGHDNLRNLFKAYAGNPNVQFAIRGFKGEGTFEQGLKWMYSLTAGMEELPNVVLDSSVFKRHSVDRVPAMIVEEVTNEPEENKDAALIESYVRSLELAFSDNPPVLQEITKARLESAPKQSAPKLRLRVYGVTSVDWVNERLDTKKDETVDIGTFGTTYPIEEKDFEEIAKERVAKIDWEAKKEAALKRYWVNQEEKFVTLPKAGEDRVREFDPSIVVPQDIYDNAGNVLHKAGSKFNPFDRSPFTKELIIYDSTDPAQVEIAKSWVADCRSRNVRFKLITTKIDTKKGWDVFTDVNKNWKTELYLLNSDIRDRFGVEKVPTRIRANPDRKVFELEELRPILGRTVKVSHRTGDGK